MRLADPHLNVFHPYRGPDASGEAAARQLENNLTRALAITLTTLGDSPGRTLLIQELGVSPGAAEGFRRCDLQVSAPDADWPPSAKRSLAIVLGSLADPVPAPGYTAKTGVLDLAIVGDQFVLGIESKVGSNVAQGQLTAHKRTLQIPCSQPVSRITWTALARCAHSILLENALEPVPRFVLQQFEEYLRVNGFGGFTNDHFAYFALSPEERAAAQPVKEGIRRQLKGLIQELHSRWNPAWVDNVGKIGAGDGDAYAALKPPHSKAGGQLPHLSIAIAPTGLQIFFNVETDLAYNQFLKRWNANREEFVGLLVDLSPNGGTSALVNAWRLEVLHRIPLPPKLRACRSEPSIEISAFTAKSMPSPLLSEVIAEAIKKPPGGWSPEIKVVRHYKASFVSSDIDFVDMVAEDARSLEPFFDWIGQPVRKA